MLSRHARTCTLPSSSISSSISSHTNQPRPPHRRLRHPLALHHRPLPRQPLRRRHCAAGIKWTHPCFLLRQAPMPIFCPHPTRRPRTVPCPTRRMIHTSPIRPLNIISLRLTQVAGRNNLSGPLEASHSSQLHLTNQFGRDQTRWPIFRSQTGAQHRRRQSLLPCLRRLWRSAIPVAAARYLIQHISRRDRPSTLATIRKQPCPLAQKATSPTRAIRPSTVLHPRRSRDRRQVGPRVQSLEARRALESRPARRWFVPTTSLA